MTVDPRAAAVVIEATSTMSRPPQDVFDVLADLDRHHLLTDDGMRILYLEGPVGRRTGAVVELRGPLGVRRRVTTRVQGATFPFSLWGDAQTTTGSRATLRWQLAPTDTGTRVRAQLEVSPRGFDQVLLMLGGRLWLRRRLHVGLEQLPALLCERAASKA